MEEILMFFDVVKDAVESDEYDIIEDCAETEGALVGYSIVCKKDNRAPLIFWVKDNCKDIGEYVEDNINAGQVAFSIGLVISTLGMDSLTDEFITEAGGVQQFLDKYGNDGTAIDFEVDTAAGKEDSIDAAEFKSDSDAEAVENNIAIPSCLDGIAVEEEPEDTSVEEEGEEIEEKNSEDTHEEEIEANFNPIPQEVSEDSEEEEATEKTEGEIAEEETEDAPVEESSEQVEHEKEEECEKEEEPEAVAPVIECDGIAVPWLKFENNKIVLKFSDLANLVNFVGDASKQLEETEMKDTKILVESEKIKSAQLLDRYSPAVVKEFVLQYVLGAESSTDYIRITNILNSFCEYIEKEKIDSFK